MGRPRLRNQPDPTPEQLAAMSPQLRYYYQTRLSPEAKAKRNAKSAEWYNKKKQDAEYKKQRQEQQRKAWAEWRSDLPRCATSEERKYIYNARYREKNNRRIAMLQKQGRQARNYLVRLWSANGCVCCGEKSSVAIDAHHIDPSTKEAPPSTLCRSGIAWETLFAELNKCVPVCANCHRKIHHAGLVCLASPVVFDFEVAKREAITWAESTFPAPEKRPKNEEPLDISSNQVRLPASDPNQRTSNPADRTEATGPQGPEGVVLPTLAND